MFPIDMLPGAWGTFVEMLPLKYLAYFPAAIFLGKIEGQELIRGLIVQFGWVVILFITCRVMFHRGVKRYSGYGG
jgi:ABC-2 type transport system permease protein